MSLVESDSLKVKFLDYRESLVEIEFLQVIGFKRNPEELENPKLSDDCVYEVINSKWIEEYYKLNEPVSKHKHYKLCFNACGILDVLFVELKIINSPYLNKYRV